MEELAFKVANASNKMLQVFDIVGYPKHAFLARQAVLQLVLSHIELYGDQHFELNQKPIGHRAVVLCNCIKGQQKLPISLHSKVTEAASCRLCYSNPSRK